MIVALWRSRADDFRRENPDAIEIERCLAWFDSDLEYLDLEIARDAILQDDHRQAFEILGAFYTLKVFGSIVEAVRAWPVTMRLVDREVPRLEPTGRATSPYNYLYRFSGATLLPPHRDEAYVVPIERYSGLRGGDFVKPKIPDDV